MTDCYCTACHERYEDDINSPKHYKHKKFGYCTHCRAPVEYRQMNYGRSTYYYTKNFAVFEGAGDRMHIECIKVSQKFDDEEENELQPVLDWCTVTRYELEPGRAVQYRCVWDQFERRYTWVPKKGKATEPNFSMGCFGYRDGTYTLINHEAVSRSFLKYLFKDSENLPSLYIEWLCRYAEHPQLEYLMRGGLYQVAEEYVTKNLHGIRLNWRSNDLKKIVKLHKAELKYRTILVDEFPIPGAVALLTTEDFFVVSDKVYTTTSFFNPQTLTTNYYLHHISVNSVSPFVPAVLFTTATGTTTPIVTQQVTGITLARKDGLSTAVNPGDDIELVPGITGTLTGTPQNNLAVAPNALVYSLTASLPGGYTNYPLSVFTYVDRYNVLHIAEDIDPGVVITVRAKTTYSNPSAQSVTLAPATLTITVAGGGGGND